MRKPRKRVQKVFPDFPNTRRGSNGAASTSEATASLLSVFLVSAFLRSQPPVKSLGLGVAQATFYRGFHCRFLTRGISGFAAEHLIVQAVVAQFALAVIVAEVGLPLWILFAHVPRVISASRLNRH